MTEPNLSVLIDEHGNKATALKFPEPSGTVGNAEPISARATVPVPPPMVGNGNRVAAQFPEPSGTARNAEPMFESLSSFLARAEKEPAREWLVEGFVPDRGRLLVVAPTNAGKTWVALVAAIAAAKADRAVFFVEEEGSARALGDRFKALGLREAPKFYIAHLKALMLDDRHTRSKLRELLEREHAPVMVLDPLASLWRGDENSTREANQVRSHLDELAKANPRALLVVLHHTGKAAARGEGDVTFAGRGSSVFPGWADMQVNLSPVASERGSGVFSADLSVTKDREGERGLKQRIRIELRSGDISFVDAEDDGREDIRGEVLTIVSNSRDGLRKTAIATQVRRKRQTVLSTVDVLTSEGRLLEDDGVYRVKPESGDDEAAKGEGS